METYGRILLIAMPIFLLLVLLEKWYGWYKGKDTVRIMDMVSSLTSGVTNVTKDVLGLSIAVLSYSWMVGHLALVQVPNGMLTYVIAFLALDFSGYWVHRIQHTTNFFWNAHLVHHSSEDFNLACALRQSISVFVRLFTFFLLPAAFLGVPAQVIAVVGPLHLFIQFWYHTQHINRMGWLEKIIVTPSHHRVHHAINPEYIDRNYAQVFIIWDKLFGTFQEEQAHIPPVYGITRPVSTWNPIKINFQHLGLLITDAWRANRWQDKFRIWFMPTGWRPADVAASFPVRKIEDIYQFEKYGPAHSGVFRIWVFAQLVCLLLFVSYLFAHIAKIGSPGIFLYGGFIFLFIYAMTELMDRSTTAWVWESFKAVLGGTLIWTNDGWYQAERYVAAASILISGYLVMSLLSSILFTLRFRQTANAESIRV
jgi:alkylglycerol monooxygenase